MNDFLIGVLSDYIAEISLLLTLAILAYLNKTHPEFRHKLKSWRNWVKGPNSWSWCMMMPVLLSVMAVVVLYELFIGIYVAAALVFLHTELSLIRPLNAKATARFEVELSVDARATLGPIRWFSLMGKDFHKPVFPPWKHITRK